MTPRRLMMTTDTVGGVWVYATGLAQGLARRGVRVTLVTLGPRPSGWKRAEANALPSGVELIPTDLALEWRDPEGCDIAAARCELLRIAAEVAPDIVHLNGFREGAFAWPCPALVVAHSCVWSWWKEVHKEWPSEPRWVSYRDGVAAGLRAAHAWAAPTAAFRDTIQDLYQPAATGWVTRNGIDRPLASQEDKEPVILASGRVWDGAKNLFRLAGVAGELPWPVEIIGPGAPHGTEQAAPNVRWYGECDRVQLRARMSRAAVYAAPAQYEPFGLGILEAAAAGCALVLSDIPSLRELWDGAALFVPPNDTEQMCAALVQICTSDALRAPLQRAAAVRARRYTMDRMVCGYLDLYETMLSRLDERMAPAQEAFA
jgi:glycosyltransferase involved in cell wall biosynthesis